MLKELIELVFARVAAGAPVIAVSCKVVEPMKAASAPLLQVACPRDAIRGAGTMQKQLLYRPMNNARPFATRQITLVPGYHSSHQ